MHMIMTATRTSERWSQLPRESLAPVFGGRSSESTSYQLLNASSLSINSSQLPQVGSARLRSCEADETPAQRS